MNKIVDKALDKVWDWLEPVSGECPVCALIRGFLIGVAIGLILGFVAA